MEGLTFDTQAEDMRHVWIPLSLKMCISKTQGLEVSSLSVGDEVRKMFFIDRHVPRIDLNWQITRINHV